ncbi:MAG: nucleotidyl transferase AbiEii/AbiGii toxin family protein [Microthrixaceae bacterium]|nr:nucleotidyl transferase AbiEii/AbiGii toxin family protein [Microthrixaceae bacterium]
MTDLSDLSDVVPGETLRAWEQIAAVTPPDGILMGGTALAVHLRHRVSRDLDIFTTSPFDSKKLEDQLRSRGQFATTLIDDHSLNGLFEGTKVQFLVAEGQTVLAAPTPVGGLNVGSLQDILATKVKVIGDRAELRDYFDLMEIERRTEHTVDEGLILYLERFGVPPTHASIHHIIVGFGYFDDLGGDPYLEAQHGSSLRDEVVDYWRRRQPGIVANFDAYVSET